MIRDGNWNVQANQNVAIKISIIEDTPNGTAVYEEYHNATRVGLISVGEGNGTLILLTGEIDMLGGANYVVF